MSASNADINSSFHGAGSEVGLEIWCVENRLLVPVPKSSLGKFYSGSAYVILKTSMVKEGTLCHEIHYWLGKDADEVDSALASDKALELDFTLGSRTVQYKEIQGAETEKFLSYFKPCIIPVEGAFSSGSNQSSSRAYQVTLLACKGDHAVSVKEVPFSRSSLNHNDIFILDSSSKIFLFSGCNSRVQERAKALEVVQYLKDEKHSGKCKVATIEDGKFVGDSDAGEFWSFFGGYAPIPRDSPSFFQRKQPPLLAKLFWITNQGKLSEIAAHILSRNLLCNDKCYMLDCNSEVYVWMGRATSVTEKKKSISTTEDFLRSEGRTADSQLTIVTQGLETPIFRSYFDGWPQKEKSTLYEEGREKVAAMFKQRGYSVSEIPSEECHPCIDCSGTLKVWWVDGNELSVIPAEKEIKIFSGDCYVMQYTYSSNEREEHIFFAWLGRSSMMVYRNDAISHLISKANPIKVSPVLAQIVQDKEPDQFFWITQRLIVLKGGKSRGYKSYVAEAGLTDETYDGKKTSLFRVQGINADNMQAIQVDPVSYSLNSCYCYILQTENAIYSWLGNLTSSRDHDLLDRMLELLDSTWQPLSLREGGEPDDFWKALGGKTEYPREKEMKFHSEDVHLFLCHTSEDDLSSTDLKVKEIFNFAQDDLTTEDVFILDCYKEIYVWMGSHSTVQSKEQAFKLGKEYLKADILGQGLSLDTPIYIVTEGYEPEFYTCFFSWDLSKAKMHGNSFERKLAVLKGERKKMENHTPPRSTQRRTASTGSRSRSLSSTGTPRTLSPAYYNSSIAASQSSSSPNNSRRLSFSSPITKKQELFPGESPAPVHTGSGSDIPNKDAATHPIKQNARPQVLDHGTIDDTGVSLIYPYERLKVNSSDPLVSGIDMTKREAYLCEEEFEEQFGMTKESFYELPKWKQNKLKMSLHLF